MKVEIEYIDKTGNRRTRWFQDNAEAFRFVVNPPKGVAEIVNAPEEFQLKAQRRGKTKATIAGLRHRDPGWVSGPNKSQPVISSNSIQFSWARKGCRLFECFSSVDEAAAALVERYSQGWAINTLAREFHLHRDTITNLLVENNTPIDRRRFRKLQEARAGWEEAFSKPTASALYWAGFLMADGSIVRSKGEPCVQCRIGLRDIDHIRALCDFVGRGKPQMAKAKGQVPLVGWRVISQLMANDLARWGIFPGKGRLNDAAPKGQARISVDFWRGMIDGDGSIRMSGRSPQVQLTGRRGISEAFIEFVEANLKLHLLRRYDSTTKRYLRKLRIYEYPEGGGTKVILNGQNAVALCELLYSEASDGLYLRRKREAAIQITGQYLERQAQAKRGASG